MDIDQGLSQNDVTYVLQDSRGFMWFATYSGLNRYDGYNFKIYKSVQDDSSSLRSNKIITLFEDHNGVLWVGTFGGGLSRFNRQKENFTTFTNNPDDPYSLPDNSVQTIFEDHKHRLWVGTNNGGLSLIFNNDSINSVVNNKIKFINFLPDPDDSMSISCDGIMKVLEDSNHDLWFSTTDDLLNKLVVLNDVGERYKFKIFNPDLNYAPNEIYISIDQIMEDQHHPELLWLTSSTAGLLWFNTKIEKFLFTYPFCNLPGEIRYDRVWSVCWTQDNEIFLGTFGNGIYSFVLNENVTSVNNFNHYKFQKIKPNLTESAEVQNIFEDKSGIVCFGTIPNGVYTFIKRTKKFKNYYYDASSKNSLSNDLVLSVLETEDGNLWIGSEKGIDIFNTDRNKIFNFQQNQREKERD